MTELLAWLIGGTLILAAITAVLPVLLWLAGIALAAWIFGKSLDGLISNQRRIRQRKLDIIARADRQHHLIMSGDEEAGTYGNYLPPPSLR